VKVVRAAAGDGERIRHYRGEDETDEAQWVARSIVANVKDDGLRYSDHALLFRTNAMMRRFEEELRHARVPYRVVGATSFFERREVKDVLAYMRFLANPDDELSMMRVMRVPDKRDRQGHGAGDRAPRGPTRHRRVPRAGALRGRRRYQRHAGRRSAHDSASGVGRISMLSRTGPAGAALRAALTSRGYVEALAAATKDQPNAKDRLDNVEEIPAWPRDLRAAQTSRTRPARRLYPGTSRSKPTTTKRTGTAQSRAAQP